MIPFDVGSIYHRGKEIHVIYSGQCQGGISTPAGHPYVFLLQASRTTRTLHGEIIEDRVELEVKMHDKLEAMKLFIKMAGMKPDTQDQRGGNVIVLPPLENEEDQLKRMRIYDVDPESDG